MTSVIYRWAWAVDRVRQSTAIEMMDFIWTVGIWMLAKPPGVDDLRASRMPECVGDHGMTSETVSDNAALFKENELGCFNHEIHERARKGEGEGGEGEIILETAVE
jgi:hypothetical protein